MIPKDHVSLSILWLQLYTPHLAGIDLDVVDADTPVVPKRTIGASNDQLYGNNSEGAAPSTSLQGSVQTLWQLVRIDTSSPTGVSSDDVGARVTVEGYSCEGTIRFVGVHHVKGIERCGVELDDPVGKNNGTVSGHAYFACAEKHGVLVAPRKVWGTVECGPCHANAECVI